MFLLQQGITSILNHYLPFPGTNGAIGGFMGSLGADVAMSYYNGNTLDNAVSKAVPGALMMGAMGAFTRTTPLEDGTAISEGTRAYLKMVAFDQLVSNPFTYFVSHDALGAIGLNTDNVQEQMRQKGDTSILDGYLRFAKKSFLDNQYMYGHTAHQKRWPIM